jgi:hypothetical protein
MHKQPWFKDIGLKALFDCRLHHLPIWQITSTVILGCGHYCAQMFFNCTRKVVEYYGEDGGHSEAAVRMTEPTSRSAPECFGLGSEEKMSTIILTNKAEADEALRSWGLQAPDL